MCEAFEFRRAEGLRVEPLRSRTAKGSGGYTLASSGPLDLPPSPIVDLVTAQAILDLGSLTKPRTIGRAIDRRLLDLAVEGFLEARAPDGLWRSGLGVLEFVHPNDERDAFFEAMQQTPLTCKAILHAIAMRSLPQKKLARALYHFHTEPFPSELALCGRAVDNAQSLPPPSQGYMSSAVHGWLYFRHNDRRSGGAMQTKLYVSPASSDFADCLSIVHAHCARAEVETYKCRASDQGQRRPDKIVVYFRTVDARTEFAAGLSPMLADITPHGVPFARPFDRAGVLFDATDPSPEIDFTATERRSWRGYISDRLARFATCAPEDATAHEALGYLLRRIALDEVALFETGWAP